tara:strand:- start:649 stop:882 length:234 start_codon:yes stop_codon:yes gene_type:complete
MSLKKFIINPENPDGIYIDLTPEEVKQREAEEAAGITEKQAYLDAVQANKDLKASAKAKLVAGEKLTEEEANILVGV